MNVLEKMRIYEECLVEIVSNADRAPFIPQLNRKQLVDRARKALIETGRL